jgi:hypothetical protein
MKKVNAVLIAFIAMTVWCGVGLAQEKSKDGSAQGGNADAQPAKDEIQPFRLDFSFNEIEDGKKVNSRHYSTDLTEESGNQVVKIGTRVPVTTASSGDSRNVQYQYIDVGTTINSRLNKVGGGELRLHVDSEISNLDTTDEPSKIAPIVRQIKIEGTTLLVLGKPILIGTADDPNSKRQFQLEVTATRLR